MKKINNKGVTLVELIVSFAIVGVAVIYFFQTLYTVKTIYQTATEDTNDFVDKTYTFKILDAHFNKDGSSLFNTTDICGDYNLECSEIIYKDYSSGLNHYQIKFNDDSTEDYYLYKNIMSEFKINNNRQIDCPFACSTKVESPTQESDVLVSGDYNETEKALDLVLENPLSYKVYMDFEYWRNASNYCEYQISNFVTGNDYFPVACDSSNYPEGCSNYYSNQFDTIHKSGKYEGYFNRIILKHGNSQYNSCYFTIKYLKIIYPSEG